MWPATRAWEGRGRSPCEVSTAHTDADGHALAHQTPHAGCEARPAELCPNPAPLSSVSYRREQTEAPTRTPRLRR